jgi:hypothetical protein
MVEKCAVKSSGIGEFASIRHGTLEISGRMAEGLLGRETVLHNGEERITYFLSFAEARLPMRSDYLLDHEGYGYTSLGTWVFVLRMCLHPFNRRDCLLSLVLKRSPSSPDYFERISSLQIVGEKGSVDPQGSIFQTAESRTVVII